MKRGVILLSDKLTMLMNFANPWRIFPMSKRKRVLTL